MQDDFPMPQIAEQINKEELKKKFNIYKRV